MDNRYIGIFDSGVGGLTSVPYIMDLFPNERVIFFGDTARTPYGSKAPETIRQFTLEIGAFMAAHDVKLMAAACNTISATSLEVLQAAYPDIPVLGTIDATSQMVAAVCSPSDRIGILATKATVSTEMYPKAIRRAAPEVTHLYQKACPMFVPLIEEGIVDHPIMDMTIHYYLDDFIRDNRIDTLVLGCTHYPLISGNLRRLYPGIRLISSSKELAVALGNELRDRDLQADETNERENIFYASDLSDSFLRMTRQLLGDGAKKRNIRFKNLDLGGR